MTYSVIFNAVAVTAQQDLFEIATSASQIVLIHSIELTQSTEVGDAQEEGLNILVKRGATVTGSGGTTPVPVPLDPGTVTFAGTTKANNTTKANTGTIVTAYAGNWNVRGPFLYLPPPEDRITIPPSGRLTVELATTPADSITMSGTVVFESLGA
jgi:hypothetical protein